MKILNVSEMKIEDANMIGEEKLTLFRQIRKKQLQAFDIYKTNLFYGLEEETEEEKIAVIDWYNGVLNLNADAIKNIPQKVKKYV